MCGDKTVNFVSSCDQLGVPVSLNLNKKSTHQTFPGGCCSIMAIVLIFTVFVSEISQVFFELNYS